jgi:tetratricopeptide (TPR) repeat protein
MNRMVDNPTALYAESPVYVSFNYNDVYPTGTGYLNVRANLYAYVGASNAYWGQYPPNPAHFLATNGAYIAYLPGAQSPYRNPPSKIIASSHGANTSMESELVSHTNLATDQSAPDSIIEEAIQLMNQDRYEEAIALLKQGLREAEIRIEKQYLLSLLAACYRTTEKEGFFDFLDGEIVTGISGHDDLYATTLEIKNLFLIRDGNYQSAIENYQVLREEFSSHALFHKSALFGLGYVYTEMLNQPERGKEYFIELVSTYPEDALTEAAILTMSQYNESLEEFLVNGSSAEIPDKPVLFDNFPNPFNPTTVIRFSIPDNERITLRVYDILGRVVAVLADDIYESGTHQITFDASRLASWVYFSRIDFAGQSIVQRMLLVK